MRQYIEICRHQVLSILAIVHDRPKQPANEMFGIKRRLQRCKVRPPTYECIKLGYPLQNMRFLLLSTNLARERLQIDRDLLRIITSTADELSGGTNINDLERPWTPKIGGFSEFFCYSRLRRTLRVNFRWNHWRQTKTTWARNQTDAVTRLMSISSDFLLTLRYHWYIRCDITFLF